MKQKIGRLYLDKTKTATITVIYSAPVDRSELDKGIPPCDGKTIGNLVGKGVAEDLLLSHYEAFMTEVTPTGEGSERLKRKGATAMSVRLNFESVSEFAQDSTQRATERNFGWTRL